MILVFDLDDTLYPEIDFVKSGLAAVDAYLMREFKTPSLYGPMFGDLCNNGRGRVFDNALSAYGLNTKKNIQKCVSVYRLHLPAIKPSPEALSCLDRLAGYRKYIVTDGNKIVQANKISALGIEERFVKCFISRRYGICNEKPSPYCFNKIAQLEKCGPEDVVYVGDNPNKDFVGIKPLGFRTVRVAQGCFKNLSLDQRHEAEVKISSLKMLTKNFLTHLTGKKNG